MSARLPALVYDGERDLFRWTDGRFAFSREHADWALSRGRTKDLGFSFDNRENPYMFRNAMLKLLLAGTLHYNKLIEDVEPQRR